VDENGIDYSVDSPVINLAIDMEHCNGYDEQSVDVNSMSVGLFFAFCHQCHQRVK